MNNRVVCVVVNYVFFLLSIVLFVFVSKVFYSLPLMLDAEEGLGFRVVMIGWSFYLVAGACVLLLGSALYVMARFLPGDQVLHASLVLPVTVTALWLSIILFFDVSAEGVGFFVDEFFVAGILGGSCVGGFLYYFVSYLSRRWIKC